MLLILSSYRESLYRLGVESFHEVIGIRIFIAGTNFDLIIYIIYRPIRIGRRVKLNRDQSNELHQLQSCILKPKTCHFFVIKQ